MTESQTNGRTMSHEVIGVSMSTTGSADNLSDDEVNELEKEIDVAIRQGSIIAGKSGATGNRLLGELMQPQVDWREVLREFIQTTCTGNDYSTWKRPTADTLEPVSICPAVSARKSMSL